MSERVRCVYCDEIVPGSLYCQVFRWCMSEHEANAPRVCEKWVLNPMNAITLEVDYTEQAEKPEPVETIRMDI